MASMPCPALLSCTCSEALLGLSNPTAGAPAAPPLLVLFEVQVPTPAAPNCAATADPAAAAPCAAPAALHCR